MQFSKFAVSKIVREYGYPPQTRRRAIQSMMRRGISWKGARQSVAIVNAATAHSNYEASQLGLELIMTEETQQQ